MEAFGAILLLLCIILFFGGIEGNGGKRVGFICLMPILVLVAYCSN